MKKEQVNLSLEEISFALAQADKGRMSPELSPKDREIMEQACVTLREAERQAIVNVETGLVERFRESADGIKLQSKNIRSLVARLNRIPKSLAITESVIKECIKVLKAVALWCTMFFMLFYLSGCASMSKAQLKRVNSLAVVSDSAVCGPGSVFRILDDVRTDRGLMYVASLQSADARISELNGLALARQEQSRLADKADVCISILDSYIRALRSASSDSRWKQNGIELRGIGRNMDSLAIAYNKLQSFRRAHAALLKELDNPRTYSELSDELFELNRQVQALSELVW